MAKCENQDCLEVAIPGLPPYPIVVAEGLLQQPDVLRSYVHSNQLMVVTDTNVAPLYLECLQVAFADKQCDWIILPAGEPSKNIDSLMRIYDALMQHAHHRDTTLIALGGGVVGDMTGFAASTYQRGVNFIQIPTTLLAQVDASVGGKTGINHPLGKNMIGSFYQPQAVLIDKATLVSLPLREFRAAWAEIIKYALLVGGDFFNDLRLTLEKGISPLQEDLAEWIVRSCKVKVDLVVADEQDRGCRALLNLGHTFAHALETATHYSQWLHGEAVAIGLYCAARLSTRLGLMDTFYLEQIAEMLNFAALPITIPQSLDVQSILKCMHSDKKIKGKLLPVVVMNKPGDCYLSNKISTDQLLETLVESCKEEKYGRSVDTV